ncbi:MAG TPA: hypothetical protein DE147_09240 [Gammaproteobacteria bacterium]|nr:hypothetical protein [Gammaproteobacteria bacterium]
MKYTLLVAALTIVPTMLSACMESDQTDTASTLTVQRANLAEAANGAGFGPQSPRHIDEVAGANPIRFGAAPPYTEMNLCNIHFHKNAEHAGGEFSRYAGNGDGKGFDSGYLYTGKLSAKESAPIKSSVCHSAHGALQSGDTVEVHYVFSSAAVTPGPTLGACLNEATANPQLRVEAQVFVLTNDKEAQDFAHLAAVAPVQGYQQAPNILNNTGQPVAYAGSTTGPSYNEVGSPLQVSWRVRPKVAKLNIHSVAQWCTANIFGENHAHGVRNLVVNPKLLSPISR